MSHAELAAQFQAAHATEAEVIAVLRNSPLPQITGKVTAIGHGTVQILAVSVNVTRLPDNSVRSETTSALWVIPFDSISALAIPQDENGGEDQHADSIKVPDYVPGDLSTH